MLTRLPSRRALAAPPADFHAYCIIEQPGESPTWIRCGHARLNRDGSLNVQLDALPLSGELHLRAPAALPPRDAVVARAGALLADTATIPLHS